ncbi:MAG: phosphoribosylformylglycinamidine synthase subunit PurS [Actinomycetota bacterium]
MRFAASINVMPKAQISDPQGQAVERVLPGLGFDSVVQVRVGKRIEMVLEAADRPGGEALAVSIAEKMLANPVIEDFELRIVALGVEPSDASLAAGLPG